jgi:Mg-chelatase subunit ChlI
MGNRLLLFIGFHQYLYTKDAFLRVMKIENLTNDSFSSIIGLDDIKKQLRSALLLGRHVVLVGGPGMGKTTMVKDVASLIKKTDQEVFVRVQGSPDLTVEDLIGDIDPLKAMEFGPLSQEAFTPGKIFKANGGILFFDELNRCSQRLQNALLQVLEEKKVTIGRFDVDVDVDLVFIGTMNPQDTNTEPLSDVLLDRFDLIYVHYPTQQADEEQIVKARGISLLPFPDDLYSGMIKFIRDLRTNKSVEKVPSVRASIGLYERSQAVAQINGRSKVSPFDILEALPSVLAHRVRLKPSVSYTTTTEKFLTEQFAQFCEEAGISLEAQGP